MNKIALDLLNTLASTAYANQRTLAETSGYALGTVNKAMRELEAGGYLSPDAQLTEKAREELATRAPKNAIILAAGVGMRMAPVNLMQPKGMLEVHGEPLVERLVRQLKEAGIDDITIVVGFMKERFDYLIDEHGVKLQVNRDFASKNNLHSLALVADRLENTYVVPSDLWAAENPFSASEPYSWYMVTDAEDSDSEVRVARNGHLTRVRKGSAGNEMIGIAYLLEDASAALKARLAAMDADPAHDDDFWEDALFSEGVPAVMARVVADADVVEIDTYEQLRELDANSGQLHSDAIETIAQVFDVPESEIVDIATLRKGMTNRSFCFSVRGQKYIMRVPGEGTDQLINRAEEAEVYETISGLGLCDDPVYINPENGFKITRFLDGIRVCDPENVDNLKRCMAKLKSFHRMRLSVPHTFDIFERTEFYESLWGGMPSEYRDYATAKANVFSLRGYVESQPHDWCLTHIDAVPDNFLFCKGSQGADGQGGEDLQLTDWEYSGMQDPHVDIAMFAIYSMYGKAEIDRLIDIYFEDEGGCTRATRAKIYCYVAMCGLLWSNWCEYKRNLGVEFGEYSLAQYRFAKDFYRFAKELMDK